MTIQRLFSFMVIMLYPILSHSETIFYQCDDGTITNHGCDDGAILRWSYDNIPESWSSQDSTESKYTGERISLDYADIEVRSIFKILDQFTKYKITIADNVNGRLEARYKNEPWDKIFDELIVRTNLEYTVDKANNRINIFNNNRTHSDSDYSECFIAYQKQNYSKALTDCKKHAEKGNTEAQYIIGFIYLFGLDTPENYPEAYKWITKSSNGGNMEGQFYLGLMYQVGGSIPEKDVYKSAYWYKLSAEQGYAPSQYAIGECYEKGNGVNRNMEKSIYWYRKAAEQTHETAIESLKRLGVGSGNSVEGKYAVTEEDTEQKQEDPITLNFADISVRSVLSIIGDFSGYNIRFGKNVHGSIDARYKNQPWDKVFIDILDRKNLDYDLDNDNRGIFVYVK